MATKKIVSKGRVLRKRNKKDVSGAAYQNGVVHSDVASEESNVTAEDKGDAEEPSMGGIVHNFLPKWLQEPEYFVTAKEEAPQAHV